MLFRSKNGEKKDAPISDEIKVSSNDKLIIAGTSFAGASVAVFIGEEDYKAETDTNGNWTFNAPISKIKDGSYTVQAQAQTAEGKGSEKADLFKLKKEENKPVAATQNPSIWQKILTTYFPYVVGSLIVLLLALTTLLYYLTKKREIPKPLEKKPIEKIADEQKPRKKIKLIQN